MKITHRILFKGLKIVIFSVVGVISVLCLSLLFILGTPSGTKWLLGMVNSYSGGELSYAQLDGHLLGDLRATELAYSDKNIQLKLNTLILQWQPEQLFQRRFNLGQLVLDTVYFEQKTQAETVQEATREPESDESFTLSDIILPMAVNINELTASDVKLILGPNEKPILIELLSFKADANESTINISNISLKLPELEFSSHGKVVLTADYPLQVNTVVQLHMSDLPQIELRGLIAGNLQKLDIYQTLGGAMGGKIDAVIHRPISELTWDTTLELTDIPFRLLDKSINNNDVTFDVSLTGKGDLNKAVLQPAQADLGEGKIVLAGQLSWQPELSWNLLVNTENIDPGVLYPQLPGSINLHLESEGKQENTADGSFFDVQLALKDLQGTFLEQHLSGKGYVELKKNLIQIQQLQLTSGQAKIHINGSIDEQLDLQWLVDIPNLKNLLPEMTGVVSGKGEISGTQSKPVLLGKVDLGQFNYENSRLNQAKLDFSLSTDTSYANHLSLSIDKVESGTNAVRELLLTVNGPIEKHTIAFKSQLQGNQLLLNLQGGFDDALQQWQGNVEHLAVKGKMLGSWQQKTPAHLAVSQDSAVLDTLCLFDKQSSLCTKAKWQPEQSQAELQIKNVDLKRIKSFLPKEIEELSGEINLDAQMTLQETLKADLNVELEPGFFSYRLEPHKRIRLKHKNGQIKVVYGAEQVRANWNLNMGEHGLEGNIAIPRLALESDPNTAPIQGRVKLDVKELGLITALVKEIKEAEGFLHADLQLGGIIAEPIIVGKVEFISEKINIPLTGVEFTHVNLKLNAKENKRIDIKGQLNSGEEKIALNGDLFLDAEKNWPVSLQIQGNNFQVIKLPDIQAKISPDIEVKHGVDGVKVSGSVTIPQAEVHVKQLPEGSRSVSDDVVIVGAEETKVNTKIAVDMTVKLGEKVHIKAFGLDTNLMGQIRIKQTPGQLATANGELSTKYGTFRAYGQDLIIKQGRVFYAGGYLDDPGLNIKAAKEVKDTLVGVMVNGSAKNLQFDTYSDDPELNSKDIASLLLTGQKFDNTGQARVYAGTALTDDLSVGINMGGGDEGSEAVVRYKLGENIHLEGTSSAKKSGGDIIYTIEIE